MLHPNLNETSADEESQKKTINKRKEKQTKLPRREIEVPSSIANAVPVSSKRIESQNKNTIIRPLTSFVTDFKHNQIPHGQSIPPCERVDVYLDGGNNTDTTGRGKKRSLSNASENIITFQNSSTNETIPIPVDEAKEYLNTNDGPLTSESIKALVRSNPTVINGMVESMNQRGIIEQEAAWRRPLPREIIFQSIKSQLFIPIFYAKDTFQSLTMNQQLTSTDEFGMDIESNNNNNNEQLTILNMASSAEEREIMVSEHIATALRNGSPKLPILDSSLEDELLFESGSFYHPLIGKEIYFPPCMNGDECVAMQLEFPGMDREENMNIEIGPDGETETQTKGFVLTQLMYNEEYIDLLQNGTVPINPRPCVACCRHKSAIAILAVRAANASVAPSMNNIPKIKMFMEREIFQIYQNKVNEPGGYFKDYMLIRKNQGDEPIIGPICMLNLSSMVVYRDPETGRRYFDQRKIKYAPPEVPEPDIGHQLSNFMLGADR